MKTSAEKRHAIARKRAPEGEEVEERKEGEKMREEVEYIFLLYKNQMFCYFSYISCEG